MTQRGESIRVMHPLFHEGDGGSIPTSPLQLTFGRINQKLAATLNESWHSRLPEITNWQNCEAFGAEFSGIWYACAMWSIPSARALNGRGWLELRRMAIHDSAPKNTASRFLAWMVRELRKLHPELRKLISYQDTDVHIGTIYKASGWKIGNIGKRIDETQKYNNWKTRPGRKNQSLAPKVRWELDL